MTTLRYARISAGRSRWIQVLDDGARAVIAWKYPEDGSAEGLPPGDYWAVAHLPDTYVDEGEVVTLIERGADGLILVVHVSAWNREQPPSLWHDCAVIASGHRTLKAALEEIR